MSDQGPSDPAGDRPRLAEALASLKEGLRDTADPFYDSWKVKRRSPSASASPDGPTAATVVSDLLLGGPTIEQSRPPEWHLTEVMAPLVEPPIRDGATALPGVEVADLALATEDIEPPPLPTEDIATPGDEIAWPSEDVAFSEEGPASSSSVDLSRAVEPAPPSVPADTVRVRVVPYRVFPRWALVGAATMVVFSLSVFVLRATLPESSQPPSLTLPTDAVEHGAEIPPGITQSSIAVTRPREEVEKPPAIDPLAPEPAANAKEEALPSSEGRGSVPSAVPAGKLMTPPPRRRASAHDFFRDPGF